MVHFSKKSNKDKITSFFDGIKYNILKVLIIVFNNKEKYSRLLF